MGDKLRFGIMLNGPRLAAWQLQSIQLLQESGLAEPVLLIANDAPAAVQSKWQKIKNYPWKHFIYRAWKRYRLHVAAQEEKELPASLQQLPLLRCQTIRKGKYSEYFQPGDIAAIRSHRPDFILRYGFNIIRGEVLQAARYGVWSYHHGDERTFRGGPTGFWEIYRNSLTNGVVLQQLNDLVDAGVILSRREYQTVSHAYAEHLEKLLGQNTDMPLEVCKKIMQNDDSVFRQQHSATQAPINRVPRNGQMLIFLLKLVANRVRFHYRRIFRQEQWLIGVGKITPPLTHPDELTKATKQPRWLPLRSAGRYAADPFLFRTGEQTCLVYEHYDYRQRRGRIDLAELDNQLQVMQTRPLLESETHLAYPYIFEHDGAIYMAPESADENCLRLYQWQPKEKQFTLLSTLLQVPAVDASLVYHARRWWIFCGLKGALPNEKLHIYFSDSLTGPYQAHTLNPVKVTPAGARMAGSFIRTPEALYRPGQYSCRWYGEKTVYWKIITLTPEAFAEEEALSVSPAPGWPFADGVHTLAVADGIFALDAKKRKSDRISLQAALRS